jgi:hypothetical protein
MIAEYKKQLQKIDHIGNITYTGQINYIQIKINKNEKHQSHL